MSTAIGEFGDGGNPAKSRAVSSAVDPSGLCARAVLSVSTSAVTTAAIILFTGNAIVCENARKRNPVQGGG